MGKKVMFLLLMMVKILCGECHVGKVYKVGGSSGWTNTNMPSRYKSWAASKVFHVGDTLWFKYNKQFHSVLRVSHKNFNSCNSTAPYSTWATGNDSFTITRPGHFYFICSLLGHCWAGQKVDIRVLEHHNTRPSGPTPSPSPWVSSPQSSPLPCPSLVPVPSAHSRKSGSSSLSSFWKLRILAVAISFSIVAC